ncbi:hypothetical protein GWI72_03700 [Microvirga tunisiensis]|uniref:Uncharacterized protein n=2 Tax=Pannonibacter tanglangensis TaxID=2750084 RepID=A0A7X5J811_9HYPH|nr:MULTISPECIES: hypothetical protein [unclassified Pannonibacter]NBN63720.1 hypothetical protein [Pannonibacter sp. XCT-34]NBN77367.1 hypothetical protein [Pannonibacter sp. XCT-53]
MDLVSPTPNRVEYIHDDKAQTRVAIFIVGIGAIACIVGSLVADSVWPAVLVGFAAFLAILRLQRQCARTKVVFDKANDRLLLEHRTPGGRLMGSERLQLSHLENVVLERAGLLHNFMSKKVWQRPVMIVAGRRVPLTFASYEAGSQPEEIAAQLREKFELPRSARFAGTSDETAPSSPGKAKRRAQEDQDEGGMVALARRARAIRQRSAEHDA